MAQHLAASLLPPAQRHWVGPELLIRNDRTLLLDKRPDPALFWYYLANRPAMDQILFQAH